MSTPVLVALPPLAAACPKCRYQPSDVIPSCPECSTSLAGLVPPLAHQMAWIPAAGDPYSDRPSPLPYQEPREHMQITCRRCAYRWPAAVEDGHQEAA